MAIADGRPVSVLRGRVRECAALDQLVERARAGSSGVCVLRGEPGVGKTALLDHVQGRAIGCSVARVSGVESEMEIAFAGLHQLCAPLLGRLDRLPGPQRDALRAVFGLVEAPAPDRFLVGLAVLTLLSEAAAERPLVCLVDDAQWLDRASVQAMSFVARRLLADPVALVFAVREPSGDRELDGLPGLAVQGLGDADARALLASALPGRLDERVRDRVVAESRGNPLALLEVPRGWSPAELAGGFGLSEPGHLTGRIEQSFARRLRSLPGPTQLLLLLAAAEPVGDASLLRRAADRLGVPADAARPAEEQGLVELGVRVAFHHPLVRSAVYRTATLRERRAVHRALAEATDPEVDPDRRAWHLAHAAAGPDEPVAAELERSAVRAQRRGGLAAAAAFLEHAAELTADPDRRGRRLLDAAQATYEAGAPDRASQLLATAELGPLAELGRARLERLRAQLVFARSRGEDALVPLLRAGERLAPLDADLARETYLEACAAVVFAGRFAPADRARELAGAVSSVPAGHRPMDLWLTAMATWLTDGETASAPLMRRAIRAFRDDDVGESTARWLWIASRGAPAVFDDEAWHELATRQVGLAREAGALTLLAVALAGLADVQVHEGDFQGAAASLDELDGITEVTGTAPIIHTSLVLGAWRGDQDQVGALFEAAVPAATARGEGRALTLVEYATAVLENGLGRYEAALAAARRASEHGEIILAGWALAELVEAAVRCGRLDVAVPALDRLTERTEVAGTEWARGLEARSRALVSGGAGAEALYQEAVDRLGRSRATAHLARAHLVYGEWLRRENRRVDAREQLRRADEMLDRMGARAFAERARRELLATGETARGRRADSAGRLTTQEAHVARLARDGYTNPEIGAQLFLSRRTVEWHLRKVFTKLGISSRRELRDALADGVPAADAEAGR